MRSWSSRELLPRPQAYHRSGSACKASTRQKEPGSLGALGRGWVSRRKVWSEPAGTKGGGGEARSTHSRVDVKRLLGKPLVGVVSVLGQGATTSPSLSVSSYHLLLRPSLSTPRSASNPMCPWPGAGSVESWSPQPFRASTSVTSTGCWQMLMVRPTLPDDAPALSRAGGLQEPPCSQDQKGCSPSWGVAAVSRSQGAGVGVSRAAPLPTVPGWIGHLPRPLAGHIPHPGWGQALLMDLPGWWWPQKRSSRYLCPQEGLSGEEKNTFNTSRF